jgi:hypothetical protein
MQADNRFCKNCPHHRDGHITAYNFDRMNTPMSFKVCYGNTYINGLYYDCDCSEYIPKDNLEYLEWCVDKRSQYAL